MPGATPHALSGALYAAGSAHRPSRRWARAGGASDAVRQEAAPLARAVIGGLIASTFAALTILPSIYMILQSRASTASPSLNPFDPASRYYEAR